ncbi:UDP-N-acetylmuramoylalanine--D-glutamate ligase [Orenia metallireducens]|jgi:UDP-N-acetylmuramoylalanine--D-glutamate ligase|uniref:UDP-N-acetylmuramoylalanine--D-glutamate ligase n=1 Tax=Orenia metallireducens TaxID=1413210 RepID=A0A285GW12_9FIRM|nr:UDP-N-acetylmuramoyl-L-alanine--D-glutamate ligase [Orenia metallireducens]PRX31117.1 UDP-N-acetylmuramoylalanine--D-glutamate ligase [Orenia metallireducens]SNY27494.1 UDP-N-acetylmuramoylalanine--D-glutamate ligase [Orenia metallireducens]
MELKDKLITVVGLGKRTGVETVKFLDKQGAKIIVTDAKQEAQLKEEIAALRGCKVNFDLGGHTLELVLKSDLIIISPGVPTDIPLLQQARSAGIEIISEVELAYRFCKAPIIAITGTNGKTTTTTLIGEIFKATGRKTVVGGNIGRALIQDLPQLEKEDIVIAEISSFQLEEIKEFRPDISLFLNITPDHLDRHGSFEAYIEAKRKLLMNQTQDDYIILNYDDPIVRKFADNTQGQVVFFSQQEELTEGVYLRDNKIVANLLGSKEEIIDSKEIGIEGPHNLENALGAVAASLLMGASKDILVEILKIFSGVEHRIEDVATINGVRYINDSKGTNPIASTKAIETFEPPLVIIAGGKDKGSEFDDFAKIIKEKVKGVVLLGETADKIEASLNKLEYDSIYHVKSIQEAVKVATEVACGEGIVLLSPACASWDMFDNYEQRGREFKEAVKKVDS